ncbi:MAG: response regulator transcription factor [bacterium]|nr:response regulator transcription factor [bacterium]
MSSLRLLIVDDDPKLRSYMRRWLEEHSIRCEVAADADEATQRIAEGPEFDLILLDVMMPGRDGWKFLEDLRAGGDTTPVIFLTARQAVAERVKGLELGADDYVIKPFDFDELLARITVVAGRSRVLPVLQIDELTIDYHRRTVEVAKQPIELSAREFDFLQALAKRRGEVVSRRALLREVWSIDFDPGTNVVDVLVARLRRKLGKQASSVIQTVVGEGYRLKQDTT